MPDPKEKDPFLGSNVFWDLLSKVLGTLGGGPRVLGMDAPPPAQSPVFQGVFRPQPTNVEEFDPNFAGASPQAQAAIQAAFQGRGRVNRAFALEPDAGVARRTGQAPTAPGVAPPGIGAPGVTTGGGDVGGFIGPPVSTAPGPHPSIPGATLMPDGTIILASGIVLTPGSPILGGIGAPAGGRGPSFPQERGLGQINAQITALEAALNGLDMSTLEGRTEYLDLIPEYMRLLSLREDISGQAFEQGEAFGAAARQKQEQADLLARAAPALFDLFGRFGLKIEASQMTAILESLGIPGLLTLANLMQGQQQFEARQAKEEQAIAPPFQAPTSRLTFAPVRT